MDILRQISEWAEDGSPQCPPVFWLSGHAGSGKSTIAFTISQKYDTSNTACSRDLLRATFFCSRQLESTRRRTSIIPTIAYQLARSSSSYAEALLDANVFDSINSLRKQMKDLLVTPWNTSSVRRSVDVPPYLIVIDALDEIGDSGGSAFLRDLLDTVEQGHLKGLKFLVSSRPDPAVVDAFVSKYGLTFDSVCRLEDVKPDDARQDISTYLRTKLPNIDKSHISSLTLLSSGLFIYASTIVRSISPHLLDEQVALVEAILNVGLGYATLTEKIDALYIQVLVAALAGIDAQFRLTRLRILQVIIGAEEPLTFEFISGLLHHEKVSTSIAEGVVKSLHAVLYTKGHHVFWYHASFQDFVTTPHRFKAALFSLSDTQKALEQIEDPHHLLTSSCFYTMKAGLRFNICDLPSSFDLDSEVKDLDQRIKNHIPAWLRYSCLYWSRHLSLVEFSQPISAMLEEFVSHHALFWIEAMNLLKAHTQSAYMLYTAQQISNGVCALFLLYFYVLLKDY